MVLKKTYITSEFIDVDTDSCMYYDLFKGSLWKGKKVVVVQIMLLPKSWGSSSHLICEIITAENLSISLEHNNGK